MELNDRKGAAYRMGLITLIILAVMTVAEYFVSIYTGSLILLMIIAVIKAAIAARWPQDSLSPASLAPAKPTED